MTHLEPQGQTKITEDDGPTEGRPQVEGLAVLYYTSREL